MSINSREYEVRKNLKEDYPLFARNCLFITPKPGHHIITPACNGLVPFVLNKPQLYAHAEIEKQKAEKGFVKQLVLKARQEGISTYVGGRYLWRTIHHPGTKAFILTHHGDATKNLFGMTQRFYANLPSYIKPVVDRNNSKELSFPLLNSGYQVGTAGTGQVGRSGTINFFHGSEVAFWENTDEISSGAMQAIAKESEVILESTANGEGNYFHEMWIRAVSGKSQYRTTFLPWFWMSDYSENDIESLVLEEEDVEIRDLYHLSNEQMMWRQHKISEIGISLFKQEYPCSPEEAFSATNIQGLIPSIDVVRASQCKTEAYGPIIVGVDPAASENLSGDRTSFISRQGRVMHSLFSYKANDTMEIVGRIVKKIQDGQADAICIGQTGLGVGIVDRLRELGYGKMVFPIVEGATAYDKRAYRNKKAECYGDMAKWFKDLPCQIPDIKSFHTDLCALRCTWNSNGQMVLEGKESVSKRFGHSYSPDESDAASFTFGVKLNPNKTKFNPVPNFRL